MAEDLGDFARRMGRLAVKVEKGAERTVRKVALVVDQVLVTSTPVDTGRARSNWIVSIGAPGSEIREPYSPGQGLGMGEGANAQGALDQGRDAIGRYRLDNGALFIYNNLPYIAELNNGSSAQMGAGFVERAVQQGVDTVRNAKIIGEED